MDISRRNDLLWSERSLINELLRSWELQYHSPGGKHKRVRVCVRALLPCKFREFGESCVLVTWVVHQRALESSKTISSRSELYYCESFFRLPSVGKNPKSCMNACNECSNMLSAIRSTVQRKSFLRETKNYLIKLFFAVFKEVY